MSSVKIVDQRLITRVFFVVPSPHNSNLCMDIDENYGSIPLCTGPWLVGAQSTHNVNTVFDAKNSHEDRRECQCGPPFKVIGPCFRFVIGLGTVVEEAMAQPLIREVDTIPDIVLISYGYGFCQQ